MNASFRALAVGVLSLWSWSGTAADSGPVPTLHLGQALSHWLVLKPVSLSSEDKRRPDDTGKRQAFAQDWLLSCGGEAQARPREGAKVQIARQKLKWTVMESNNGSVDLLAGGGPSDDSLAYAWSEFRVSQDQPAVLGIGSDDAVKVWLNGRLVHEHWVSRGLHLDQDLVPVQLHAGTNHVLLKIENDIGPWGFSCRVLSEEQAEGLKLARRELASAAPGTLTDNEIETALEDYLRTDKQGVGIVVGLLDEHGARVLSCGNFARRSSRAVDGDTLFEIGSVSKVFTALLLQDMIQRKEMRLDDPVRKYLPATVRMPTFKGKEITLLHLATHTSGLPREVNNATPRTWRDPLAGYTLDQFYAFLTSCQLHYAPGTKEEYSNLGVELLGHVISLRAGKDYEALLLERICQPLDMRSTRIGLSPALKARLATGHALPGSPVCTEDFSILPAAGGIKSSANDLLKFLSAYCGISASPLRQVMDDAEAEHSLESGAKRRLVWEGSGPLFYHGGLTFGYKAELGFDKEAKRGVVMLSNCSSAMMLSDSWQALLYGRPRRPEQTCAVSPSVYDQYVGLYETDKRARCSVRREGGRLMMQWLGTPGERIRSYSFEVFPVSPTVFRNKPWHNQLVQVSFEPDSNPVRIILSTSEFCLELRRTSSSVPKIPDPVEFSGETCERYAGQYRKALLGFIPVGPTLNISHETDEVGEHLVGYLSGPGSRGFLKAAGSVPGGELFPESETTFFLPFSSIEIRGTFVQNRKGKTTSLLLNFAGQEIRGVRVGK